MTTGQRTRNHFGAYFCLKNSHGVFGNCNQIGLGPNVLLVAVEEPCLETKYSVHRGLVKAVKP